MATAIQLDSVTKRYKTGRSRTIVDLFASSLDGLRGRTTDVHSVSRGRIGSTIYALKESGSEVPAASVERASHYLRSTQRADGSWYVRSRSAKFQPYFESGFPYEHDQWISSMATGWATAALALSAN